VRCGNRRLGSGFPDGCGFEIRKDLERPAPRLVAADLPLAQVRPSNDGELIVELPGADSADVARAKDFLKQAGHLAFRIVADRDADKPIAEAALAGKAPDAAAADDDSSFAWVRLDTKLSPVEDWMVTRDIESGEKEILVLLSLDDVTGNELTRASVGRDESLQPCIFGSLNAEGARKMQLLTGGNIDRRLAIILDGNLLSMPVVRSPIAADLQITGRFTRRSAPDRDSPQVGTLPARLEDAPIRNGRLRSLMPDKRHWRGLSVEPTCPPARAVGASGLFPIRGPLGSPRGIELVDFDGRSDSGARAYLFRCPTGKICKCDAARVDRRNSADRSTE
jgi:hypothetical protein